MRSVVRPILVLLAATAPSVAAAQLNSSLLQNPLPIEYDRGRNVSVAERSRPDYDPLGIRTGGVLIYPRIDLGIGGSDNVYLTENNRVGDGYVLVAPSLRAQTDWARHQLVLNTGARLRRYFDNSPRNQDEWNVSALGRFDLGTVFTLTPEVQAARVQEDPFSGQSASTVATLSSYERTFAGVRGEYRAGHVRAIVAYNHQTFDFNDIELSTGGEIDQSDRDRKIDQVIGQLEYALTPSTALYGHVSFDETDYDRNLPGLIVTRDSTGFRAIGGVSLDVSGFFRGIVGVGYSRRSYNAAQFQDVSGLSAEGRIEYFRSELTTFTLGARRVIEDSNLGNTSAFFDNRVSLKVDHELRRNILVNLGAEYGFQDYIDSEQRAKIWRIRGGGRYLLSRALSISADVSYATRNFRFGAADSRINELQGGLSLTLQR